MFDVSSFSTREWIVVAITLLFVIVVIDGIRRAFSRRDNEVKLSKQAKQGYEAGLAMDAKDAADAARVRFELPSEVRVVTRDGGERLSEPSHREDGPAIDDVPVLNEPVGEPKYEAPATRQEAPQTVEPTKPFVDDYDDTVETPAEETSSSEFEEVVSLYVESNDETGFTGTDLLEVLLPLRLRFGEMNIFHKRSEGAESKGVIYSVANAKEPGTFDLQKLNDFSTTSVVFFLQLPGPLKPTVAFQEMLHDANQLATSLNGIVLDDQRNVLHRQSVVHIDERLREFERKQLLEKRRTGD